MHADTQNVSRLDRTFNQTGVLKSAEPDQYEATMFKHSTSSFVDREWLSWSWCCYHYYLQADSSQATVGESSAGPSYFRSLGDGKQGSAGLTEGDRSLEADSGKKSVERAVQQALDQEFIHKVKNLLKTNEVPWGGGGVWGSHEFTRAENSLCPFQEEW